MLSSAGESYVGLSESAVPEGTTKRAVRESLICYSITSSARSRIAERLGGLEVHGHLEFCRKLNGWLYRLRAAQDAIHIGGGTTKVVYQVWRVGEQTTVFGRLR
jgi:hypothetical protein